jgi:hypothetical protein
MSDVRMGAQSKALHRTLYARIRNVRVQLQVSQCVKANAGGRCWGAKKVRAYERTKRISIRLRVN